MVQKSNNNSEIRHSKVLKQEGLPPVFYCRKVRCKNEEHVELALDIIVDECEVVINNVDNSGHVNFVKMRRHMLYRTQILTQYVGSICGYVDKFCG